MTLQARDSSQKEQSNRASSTQAENTEHSIARLRSPTSQQSHTHRTYCLFTVCAHHAARKKRPFCFCWILMVQTNKKPRAIPKQSIILHKTARFPCFVFCNTCRSSTCRPVFITPLEVSVFSLSVDSGFAGKPRAWRGWTACQDTTN